MTKTRRAPFETVWETLQFGGEPFEEGATQIAFSETIVPQTTIASDNFKSLPRLSMEGTGTDLNAHLEVISTLGKGGMGIVHLARDSAMGREVAVKTLHGADAPPEDRRALLSEAWTTGKLEHPNIVPVYSVALQSDDQPIIVMKRVQGHSLREISSEPPEDIYDGKDPLVWHLEVLMQVCNAMHYAHSRGVLHRDLKPDNVMVGEYGEVYVMDWGLALTLQPDPTGRMRHIGDADDVAGTPAYMAPEMTVGDGSGLSAQTDIYLLGAMLHELLIGDQRHKGANLFQVMLSAYQSEPFEYPEDVPRELAAIANKAMHVEPSERYESAEMMRRALAAYLEHRASYRLTEESYDRLEMLREAIAAEESAVSIYDLAGGCRFGFEEALNLWDQNDEARVGREHVLAAMVRYEIQHDNLVAAEAHLAAMDHPDELASEVETLRANQAGRQAKLAELERLERDVDLGIGRSARRLGGLVLALVWGITPLLGVYLQEWGLFQLNHDTYLTQAGSLICFYALIIFAFRRTLLSNRVNRRIISGIMFTCMLLVGFRFFVGNVGIPVMQAIGAELFIYALGVSIVAFVSDLRLLVGAFIWAIGAVVISFDPGRALEWMAVTNFIVPAYGAALWWKEDPNFAELDLVPASETDKSVSAE